MRLVWILCIMLLIVGCTIPVLSEGAGEEQNITSNLSADNLSAEWTVDFTASPFEGYPPLCVQFTVSGPNGEYVWDFGDGTSSYVKNPVHCYKQKGSYWVRLKYTYGSISGEVSKPDCVKVSDPEMYVDYTADPTTGPAPLTAQFSIIGDPTHIIWHFGDGSDDTTERNPKHQFREPGNYSPTLTYCIGGSCNKISKFNYIEVTQGNPVDFVAERQNGTAPVCTRFTVFGEADSFKWDFGDGTSSYEKNPVHCYSEPGLYTISLTYTIDGAPYILTKNNYLHYIPSQIPEFTATPIEGTAPLCVTYEVTNPSQSWELNFGDNSTGKDTKVAHCYGKSGEYFPSLTYCSNNLCDIIKGKNPIRVYQPQILINPGDHPNEYKFTTDAPEGQRYSWDFGDGTRAEGPTPTHLFEGEGTYHVSLVITSPCGCNAIATNDLTIQPKKPLDFTATPSSGCAPHCVQFNEQAPMLPLSRLWDFGDGQTSTEKNPFHCYQFPGQYTVSLTNTYPNGTQTEVKENYITVYAVPKPSFTIFPPQGEAPLTVTCTDTTLDYAEKRYWDFGDGTQGSEKIMEHRYDEPGDYTITLTVWGKGACYGSKSQTVQVLKKQDTQYDFSGLPRRGMAPLCTSYKVMGQIQQAELEFGDGEKTTERNPFHCYDTAGIYSPTLHACDSEHGCEDINKPGYIVAVSPSYLNITLYQGWNLISVPFSLEDGYDTLEILSSIDTAGHSIFTWNSSSHSWMRLGRTEPITPLSAFFIYSPDLVQIPIRISPEPPEYNLTRDLESGWNLVSFGDVMMVSADEAFGSIEPFWTSLIGYDALNQRYLTPVTNGIESSTASVDPRLGYWIYLNRSAQFVGKRL